MTGYYTQLKIVIKVVMSEETTVKEQLHLLATHLDACLQTLPEDAMRLFHGRGHCYEGLSFINIDWFSPVIWVVLYGDVEESFVSALAELLSGLSAKQPLIEAVSIQRRVKGRAQQDVVYGKIPESCVAKEDGMQIALNLSENQNIGFFLDAKPGRQWLAERAQDKRVLNLFAYTCSFSVAALQAGAKSVVNIDMAKGAIATGQRNHAINNLDSKRVRFLPHDIFRSTKKLQQYGPYDLVVMDPPSRQKGSFEAEKDYAKLIRKLQPMLADGAEILACLNAPYLDDQFLPNLFADNLPEYTLHHRLTQRDDFPEADLNCCLKMQVFKI